MVFLFIATFMKSSSYKDLLVWQRSIDLVSDIYKLTEKFPRSESYGLSSQMQRAAVAIPSNIAEVASRESNKEFLRFLFISQGSISELDTQLLIASNLTFLSNEDYLLIAEKLISIRKMLAGLIKFRKGK